MAEEIEAILGTFTPTPEFDRAAFTKRLQLAAWWFVNGLALKRDKPPSMVARDWRRLAERIERIAEGLDGLSGDERADLERAADELAKEGAPPPGLKVERWTYHGVGEGLPDAVVDHWPVDRALKDARRTVAWLKNAAVRAAKNAEAEKAAAGGNRAIEAEHDFFHNTIAAF